MLLDEIPDLPDKDAPAPTFDGTIAVVLHLHYPELWDEISTFLSHSKLTFRLIVTLTAPNPALEEQISFQFPGAKTLNVENLGRDIHPFVTVFQSGLLDGINLICKIHGKRSVLSGVTGARFGHLWRRRALLDLLGSPVQVQSILNHFGTRPNLGMMGPATLRLRNGSGIDPGHEASLPIRRDLCVRAGFISVQAKEDFFAGTMFWARKEALSPLETLRLGPEILTDESAQIGDQFEHGFERFFADCTRAKGFQLADIEPLVLVDSDFPIRSKSGQILAPKALFEAPRNWYRHRWIKPLPGELKGRKVALVGTARYVAKDGWLTCLCLTSSYPMESPAEALFLRDPGGFDIALWADIFQSAPQLWDSDEVLLVSDGQARTLSRAALEDPELRSLFEEVLVWHKESEAAYRYGARLKRWLV
ncbi:rhamnan synthesis F family protein [uncultured Tateyamaria sp.]|uniref:rhamnan synthesis F family protein n=1 Tax=uncultured Tateyamaria sp. TaxID=455651 RepID=UPI002627980F|nr:rhamnan synthesis F family protein [uncultured Tateyamaria sp.]